MVYDSLKTALMFQLEKQHGQDILTLLDSGQSLSVVAARLRVTPSCVSRWRKRFGIRAQVRDGHKRVHARKGS